MKRASTTLTTFGAVFLLATFGIGADDSGCQSVDSSAVKSSAVRSSYWLLYISETDTSYARSQFRVGSSVGTTIELTPPAKAGFAGEDLAWNKLLDWYERAIPGRTTSGSWTFTDADGKTYTNTLPAYREARVPASFPARLPGTASYDLVWDGEPVREGETIEVILAHDANRFQFIALFEKNVGAKNIVLPPTELGKLPRGRTRIVIQRHEDHAVVESPGSGGNILTTYESPVRTIELE